jgi:hypothetical protein
VLKLANVRWQQEALMDKRQLLAAIVAPPVGAIVACLGFVATGATVLEPSVSGPSWPAAFTHWLGFYLVFGLPVAYLAEAVVIVMTCSANRDQPSLRRITATAAALGGVLVFAVWAALFGVQFGMMLLPSGLVGGATAGVVFWLTGVRASRTAPAI